MDKIALDKKLAKINKTINTIFKNLGETQMTDDERFDFLCRLCQIIATARFHKVEFKREIERGESKC